MESSHAIASPGEQEQIVVSDSESDEDIEAQAPITSVEKQQLQNAIFREYAATMAERVTAEEITKAIQTSDDEKLSIKEILAKKEENKVIDPRDYQMELFELAKRENRIAVLDTGSGKTHIATMLLRHTLDIELEDRAQGKTHRTAVFLVDSVSLAFQQCGVLQSGLDQNVEAVYGDYTQSLYKEETWNTLLINNMVLVCVAQVLLDSLTHSFLSMERISLLIFDEAHHTKQNHPYARYELKYCSFVI
jgi:endoribonuclease Dicer